MQSRRDQLQAYRFLIRRAQAALVTGEPDIVEPPMRRLTITTLSGVMVAILVTAGFALVGLLRPTGSKDFQKAGSVIVEKQTGARYVLLQGVLHPVLNYTSALLAAGGSTPGASGPHVVLVDQSELAHTSHGSTIGIPGLPDSLPAANKLLHSAWSVCSTVQGQPGQTPSAKVTLGVGVDGGGSALADADALVVVTPTGAKYELWQGRRLAIDSNFPDVAAALGLSNAAAEPIGTALLDAIPQGPSFTRPKIANIGRPGPTVAGQPTLVGQLVQLSDGTHDVVAADGLAPVTPVQAALISSVVFPDGTHKNPVQASFADAHNVATSSTWQAQVAQFDGLPTTLPHVASTGSLGNGVCAVFRGSSGIAQITLTQSGTSPDTSGGFAESPASASGKPDAVNVSPGGAALVTSAAGGSTTVFLVAAPGQKYPLAAATVQATLGYSGQTPVSLPAQLLLMIPLGPALDPAAARTPSND